MSARSTVARMAVVGAVPLALSMAGAAPAAAHGSMTGPVSRVSACFAEGPENPRSAACKAAVKAGSGGGTETESMVRPEAPSDSHITAGAPKSAVEHGGRGNPSSGAHGAHRTHSAHASGESPQGGYSGHSSHGAMKTESAAQSDRLAETGGAGTTTNLALAGAGVLVIGAALVCLGARRRDLGRRGNS
jgi:chitin binding protein